MEKMTVKELIDILNENVEDKENSVIFIGEVNLKKENHLKNKYHIRGITQVPLYGSIVILFDKDTKFEGPF